MNKFFLFFVSCSLAGQVEAQGVIADKLHEVDAFVEAYDANGKLIGSSTATEGSPLLYDQWSTGEVRFHSGRVLTNVKLQLDLTNQELRFHHDNKSFLFTEPVSEFRIVNPDSSISTFRSGYPAIAKNNEFTFYQVLADGNPMQLIMFRYKSSSQINEYNGPTKTQYKEWNRFYIYNAIAHRMEEVNLQKHSILKKVPELKAFIEPYGSKQITLQQLATAVEAFNKRKA
jgi:hypothetical protein